MIRLLLTLLALMTGLAADGAPAFACGTAPRAQVASVQAARLGERASVQALASMAPHQALAVLPPRAAPVRIIVATPARVPVLPGIDRARE